MEWMFLVTAHDRVRVESRVLQVLDRQMLSVQSFSSVRIGKEIRVTFVVETERGAAGRIRELLVKLQDVQSIDSFAMNDGVCRTLAFFKVLCDQESRLPLLQVVSALGAQVVSVRPDSVAFQLVGTLDDIESLRISLLPYGLVEGISVASAAMGKRGGRETLLDHSSQDVAQPETAKRADTWKTVELRHAAV